MSDFKVRFALQKRSQTSPKSIMALQNMKKWTKNIIWHFGICPGQCTTDGRENTRLAYVQLKEQDFEKKTFNKSDGDIQQLLCQNMFQRDVQCALCKKY